MKMGFRRVISQRPTIMAAIVLLGAALFAMKSGNVAISWAQLFTELGRYGRSVDGEQSLFTAVIWDLRMPRILLSIGVGAALAICGAAFQAILGNYLADPYLMGVSSGASLGAVAVMTIVPLGLVWVTPAAFVLAMVAVLLVLALSRTRQGIPSERMILAGVAVSSILTAMVSVFLVLTPGRMTEALFWLMGGFSGRGWGELSMFLPYFALGILILAGLSKELNIMSVGEECASTLGVSTRRVKTAVLITGSLLAAAAVAVSGVIGFVGLIVPHVARIIVGPDHRRLVPFAALGGAILLLSADTIARSIPSAGELPVGVITAFLGGPFFLILLRRGSYGG